MSSSQKTVFDSDGHLIESLQDMAPYLPKTIRAAVTEKSGIGAILPFSISSIFGTLDGLHFVLPGDPPKDAKPRINASSHRMGSAEDWIAFLDKSVTAASVLYPTEALSVGKLRDPSYATAICRAYNDYVHDCYKRRDKRLHAMAILPMNPNVVEIEQGIEGSRIRAGIIKLAWDIEYQLHDPNARYTPRMMLERKIGGLPVVVRERALPPSLSRPPAIPATA